MNISRLQPNAPTIQAFRLSGILRLAATLVVLFANPILRAADHGHLNAGAAGTKQNDKLIFANAEDFVSSSGYVKTLTYTNAARYAGYYQGSITLAALPTTAANSGPAANAPAPGSFIEVQLASVEGPAGGAFGFWESGATNPTVSLLSGQKGTNLWALSQNDGTAGSDPFGHIHGRRMTLSKPGVYKVDFKLFDTSANGAGGGPIHIPSDELTVYFQADVNLHSVEIGDPTKVRFSAPAGFTWQLEASDVLGPQAKWPSVGEPVLGDDYLHAVEVPRLAQGQRFYRLRAMSP